MRLFVLGLVVALVPAAAAQHHGHGGETVDRPAAVSAVAEAGLLEGRGMGLAAAADANGYPGPLHVIEFADALGLSDAQRAEAERLRASMLAEAVPLGAEVLAAERHLDALFASGRATDDAVERATTHVAVLRGRLRAVHLRTHVAMRDALTEDQVARYSALRGHGR